MAKSKKSKKRMEGFMVLAENTSAHLSKWFDDPLSAELYAKEIPSRVVHLREVLGKGKK